MASHAAQHIPLVLYVSEALLKWIDLLSGGRLHLRDGTLCAVKKAGKLEDDARVVLSRVRPPRPHDARTIIPSLDNFQSQKVCRSQRTRTHTYTPTHRQAQTLSCICASGQSYRYFNIYICAI